MKVNCEISKESKILVTNDSILKDDSSFVDTKLSADRLIEMYRVMSKIRFFENCALELHSRGLMGGSLHVYIGEEAIAVGACTTLKKEDRILTTHRGHGHCIAMGAELDRMMAELLGRSTGYCKGKGGSMHIANPDLGILGANGIVGGGIPIATGVALATKMRNTSQVVLCFLGDGAANQGCFYEAMNLASIWKLPIIYICENNMYAMTTPVSEVTAGGNIAARASGFNLSGLIVDGNDVLAVYKVVNEAANKARNGCGPALIEARTYRWKGHWQADPCVYRNKEEVEEWKRKDPIKRFRDKLFRMNVLNTEIEQSIKDETINSVNQAKDFAINSPEPMPESLLEDIYA